MTIEIENVTLADADAVEERAANWLQRRQFWNWSEGDQADLDRWLAESPVHLVTFLRLEAAWTRTERLVALGTERVEAVHRNPFRSIFIRAAAGIAVIAALGIGSSLFLRPQDRTYSTPIGGRETVNFADGSRIELNTDTIVRTRMTTEQRIVWLEKGDAYFRVKHDGAHPFMVIVGNRRVTDLGTEFLVSRHVKNFEVAVTKGRVWLEAFDKQMPSQSALLLPGDVAVATAESVSVTKKSTQSLANALAWRHGVLVFDHTTLAGAAAAFNRYNREKLEIGDPTIANLTIDGSFQANNLQLFARVVRTAFGLHIKTYGDRTIISR
ncbi:MAG TPA: FecR domain-containing protein [Rhizomicrobium sp.]|nr:FecR domain-containing protein [Rhizomicrobium sp.]